MKKHFFVLVLIFLALSPVSQAQTCQGLPEGDCFAVCGNTCDYKVPSSQTYQFDLPEHISSETTQRLGRINQRGTNNSGQVSPYSLPFFITIPSDYYDSSKAGLSVKIDTIPYDSSKLNLGIQFQVTTSTQLSSTGRSIASNQFTGTYIRCESRTKNGPCSALPTPTPTPSCASTWTDTGCLGANSMGTYDSCTHASSSRPEASCTVAVPVDCVGSWGACTGTCGTGTETFSITTPASVSPAGIACAASDGATRSGCALTPCPPPTPGLKCPAYTHASCPIPLPETDAGTTGLYVYDAGQCIAAGGPTNGSGMIADCEANGVWHIQAL